MTRLEIIEQIKEKTAGFDVSKYEGFLALQVTLSDLNEAFYLEIKDGKMTIEPFEYNDRQANLIMTSANFVKMINKKLNSKIAFTTGKLKIEGDISKASELSKLLSK
jgi:putative sterol carrier protein